MALIKLYYVTNIPIKEKKNKHIYYIQTIVIFTRE